MKYKIGDYVKIVKPNGINKEIKKQVLNKVAKIVGFTDSTKYPYRVRFIPELYTYADIYENDELELVAEDEVFVYLI